MTRWLCAAMAAALLAGCGSFDGTVPTDPSRTVLGVSADEPRTDPPAVAPATDRVLAYKESQICTQGYIPVRQDVEPGTNDRAFADWQFRCAPYDFSFLGIDWAHVSARASDAAAAAPGKLESLWPF